mgnify:CR=1 FL=1
MARAERELYLLYQKNGKLKNQEAADLLGWPTNHVEVTKYRLKRKGLITVDGDKVTCNKKFLFQPPEEEAVEQQERFALKEEYYERLLDLCMNRLETKTLSDSAFTSLVLEVRQILQQL